MRKWLIFSLLISAYVLGKAQDQVEYIRQYEDLAVSEMLRTGIPASIKLAQAILESSCGKSELACKANNHFGIKCGGDWEGKSYHREDDDYQQGKLIKSCFREFNSVMESYVAHSDFLTDPAKAARYGPLFDLDITDYKGWARGLSKAGYATDPQYANRLIEIIEKYELYRFDTNNRDEVVANSPQASAGYNMVRQLNEVDYALAMKGDNPFIMAKRHDLSVRQLLRYNDQSFSKDQQLASGTKVFLQPKRNKYHGKQKFHVLKQGESMVFVSQQYGMKLEALLKRNGLEKNEVPMPGQKIMLQGKPKATLRKADPYQLPVEKPVSTPVEARMKEEETDNVYADNSSKTRPDKLDPPGLLQEKTSQANASHTVAKGETLYGIARTYGLSVDELKKMNNLSVDTIFVGQKLTWR
jgi:LysM repeat protein